MDRNVVDVAARLRYAVPSLRLPYAAVVVMRTAVAYCASSTARTMPTKTHHRF